MKDQDKLKNYFRLKETKETSQLTAMHDSGLDLGMEKKNCNNDIKIIGKLEFGLWIR